MQGRFDPNGLGYFQGMFQSAYGNLDNAFLAFEPAMRSMARCQLEWMGLMSRRGQAYLEMPSRLSRCRTPQDLAAEQSRFFETAFQQYSDSSRRMLAAWSQVFAVPQPFAPAEPKGKGAKRDIIAVPEPRQPAASARSANGADHGAERRVA